MISACRGARPLKGWCYEGIVDEGLAGLGA